MCPKLVANDSIVMLSVSVKILPTRDLNYYFIFECSLLISATMVINHGKPKYHENV